MGIGGGVLSLPPLHQYQREPFPRFHCLSRHVLYVGDWIALIFYLMHRN